MNSIRWGIIGCGKVTEVKSGPALQKTKNSELVAVMRRQGKLAEYFAKRHGVPRWYDNAEELINDTEVNAVYIATPPSTHKYYTLMAAAAGKPVYVEKPMGLNYHECQQMIKACKNANVPLFVAYYRRALPRFLKIREMIDRGIIGPVRHVSINLSRATYPHDKYKEYNWRTDPAIAGCGYFCDLAPHTIDILQFYFGKIIKANGGQQNNLELYEAEDIVCAEFEFENGIIGSGNWIFNHYESVDQVVITGTKGSITFPTFYPATLTLWQNNKTQNINIDNPLHIQQPLIQSIVDELTGKGKCPSTGESASFTNRVMDWILA